MYNPPKSNKDESAVAGIVREGKHPTRQRDVTCQMQMRATVEAIFEGRCTRKS